MSVAERTAALLDRLRAKDSEALGELFMLYRERQLDHMHIATPPPPLLLEAAVPPGDLLPVPAECFAFSVCEQGADGVVVAPNPVTERQRVHLGARMRDVRQEAALPAEGAALASSESMAGQLVSHMTSPSQAAIRRELQERLRAALDEMDPLDREVLALRHFEELGNNEVAHILGISKDAASKRHVRALLRLREILSEVDGGPPG